MEQITPALSAEEWEQRTKRLPPSNLSAIFLHGAHYMHFVVRSHDSWRGEHHTGAVVAGTAAMRAAVALANAALPDDDPRKITREKIAALRAAARELREASDEVTLGEEWGERYGGPLDALADALESYLPPERTARPTAPVNNPARYWYRDLTPEEQARVVARIATETNSVMVTCPYVGDDGWVTAAHGVRFRLRDVIGRD